MKSFWISKGILLLSVVKLHASFVSEFCCPTRNLTVIVDDYMRLYFDGAEITGLPNANIWNKPDVVDLPCTTRLIAIHGKNGYAHGRAAILASTDDEYVLTNSSWKCSNVSQFGWEEIDFDDSDWMSAVEFGGNGNSVWIFIPAISSNAVWIWLNQWTSDLEQMDLEVYCRKRLGYDCSCYESYTNNGSKSCSKVSTSSCSISSTIFGVFLGVSVLANIALISALWVLHLRKKREENEANNQRRRQDFNSVRTISRRLHVGRGPGDEDQSGVDNPMQKNDIAPGQIGVNDHIGLHNNAVDDEQINVADYEYPK